MCIHEFYSSTACGHHFPKLPPTAEPNRLFKDYHSTIAVPRNLTCTPVKLALKFYHDQVVYRPADNNCGAKVDIPKKCPIVHAPRHGPKARTIKAHKEAEDWLEQKMLLNLLGPLQKEQIEIDAAVLDRCSNRAKPGEHDVSELQSHREQFFYPPAMYAHVQDVKAFQERDSHFMAPNVRYTKVNFGCGGPFSAECLTGWYGLALLTHRLHLWGDSVTHPKACNNECLAGWSGPDLNGHRKQTWARDSPKTWRLVDYQSMAPRHTYNFSEHWAVIDYSNVGHLHDDYDRNSDRYARRHNMPSITPIYVPATVLVPVPERLDQVLRAMDRMPPAVFPLMDEVERASIEDLLERLPEAFDEEEPLSGKRLELVMKERVLTRNGPRRLVYVVEGEPDGGSEREREQASTPVETPEMAEARGQRARRALREKIAKDFPQGKRKES